MSFQSGYATPVMADTSRPTSSFNEDRPIGAQVDQPGIGSSMDEDVPLISSLASPFWSEGPPLDFVEASVNSTSSLNTENSPSSNGLGSSNIIGERTGQANYSTSDAYVDLDALAPWIPQLTKKTSLTSRREFVLWSCFSIASAVAVTNLSLTIVAWLDLGKTVQGLSTIFEGDCKTASRIDTGLHVVINVLSTLLLGASNLCIQLTVAPTRQEVDKAHRRGIWLDIGVPSFRNLSYISKAGKAVFCCLALSSVPIHFLYNSVVFSSLTANVFTYVVATEDFLTGPIWSAHTVTGYGDVVEGTLAYNVSSGTGGGYPDVPLLHNQYLANGSSFQNMSSWDCIDRFIEPFQWRPNVILISHDINATEAWKNINSSVLNYHQELPMDRGIISPDYGLCGLTKLKCNDWKSYTPQSKELNPWQGPWGILIDYCLVAPASPIEDVQGIESCQVQSIPTILLAVTICNLIKCACILWVLTNRKESLCTIGDAIASFLEKPDLTTRDLGVCDQNTINRLGLLWSQSPPATIVWTQRYLRWYQAASIRRWLFTLIASAVVIVAAIAVTISGIISLAPVFTGGSKFYWSLGFGRTNLEELISWRQPGKGLSGLLVNVVIANIWQVLISYLYIAHNALLSSMLVADEWTGFRTERKTLRVSVPRGIQRSSYFLSIPFKYGVPTIVLFAIEHWLVSQSIFIVSVVTYDWQGSTPWHYFSAGFSIVPAFLSLSLGSLVVIAQVANAFIRKYPAETTMPLAASCSVAISAACHRPDEDRFAHLMPVQWGIINEDDDHVKTCSFTTSRYVKAPKKGDILRGTSTVLENLPSRRKKNLRLFEIFRRYKGKGQEAKDV